MPQTALSRRAAELAAQAAADPLRTPAETAAMLHLKVQTLSVWRTTQRYALPYVKVGSRILYRQSAIDAFLAARTVTPGA